MLRYLTEIKNWLSPSSQPTKSVNSQQPVTVRVWTAKDSDGNPTKAEKVVAEQVQSGMKEQTKGIVNNKPPGNVGHVSIQTTNIYASLWPALGIQKKSPTVTKEQVRQALPNLPNEELSRLEQQLGTNTVTEIREGRSLRLDERDESGMANVTTTLFSLNSKAINKKYEEMKGDNYILTDKVNPKFKTPHAQNCSTLAYTLLKEGGINELSPICHGLENSITPLTPNALTSCIQDAKKNELKKYPQTKDFPEPEGESFSPVFKRQ